MNDSERYTLKFRFWFSTIPAALRQNKKKQKKQT